MSPLRLFSKFVTSKDGTQIYAEATAESPSDSKPAIVFVHGFSCSGASWDCLFASAQLQERFYMIRYDTRAHGLSGKPRTADAYTSARYAEDFMAVCTEFGVKNPFYAGWSMGGSIAADILANVSPNPIRGIIWFNAIPYGDDPSLLSLIFPPETFSLLTTVSSSNADESIQARIDLCKLFIAPRRLSDLPREILHSWVGTTNYLPNECIQLMVKKVQDSTKLREACANGLPVCAIDGDEDQIFHGVEIREKLTPLFKDMEVHTLKGVGHMTFWEDTEACKEILIRFADRVVKSGA